MKKSNTNVCKTLLVLLVFSSCFGASKLQKSRNENIVASRDQLAENFVQYNNGEIKKFNSLKVDGSVKVFSYKKMPVLVGDNQEKIEIDSIVSYQTKDYYAKKILNHRWMHYWPSAESTLLGFGQRVIKGKISVYFEQHQENADNTYNGRGSQRTEVYTYYMQKGDNGAVIEFTKKSLREIVKDNSIAFEKSQKKKFQFEDFIDVIKTYNN